MMREILFLLLFFMDAPKLLELVEKFLQHGQVMKNYSQRTLMGYRRSLKLFMKDTGITEISQLNRNSVEAWFFDGRVKRKWGAVSFRYYLKYINCFLKWLLKQDYIKANYVDGMEKPRMEQRIPRTLTHDEAQTLLDYSFHSNYRYNYERYRNRAVIGIMLMAGLRKGEVTNLKYHDVSIEGKSIFINLGKGGKDRIIPINARLSTILSEYMVDRARLKRESPYFFISMHHDEPFGDKGIQRLVERLRKRSGLNFSAHTLRHAFARLMLEGGCDIYTLSKIMGHSTITTTTIYLACSNQQMSKSIEMHSLN